MLLLMLCGVESSVRHLYDLFVPGTITSSALPLTE